MSQDDNQDMNQDMNHNIGQTLGQRTGQGQMPVFDPSTFSNEPYVRRVEKPWGYELHFAQEDLPYMGKLMHIDEGHRQSLQIHDVKQETFILIKGRGGVLWENNKGEMIFTEFEQFVGYRTSVGQKHRLCSITDCDIMEASTPEAGTTWRLHDDYERSHEKLGAENKERTPEFYEKLREMKEKRRLDRDAPSR